MRLGGGIILAVAWSASKDADDATSALDSNSPSVIDTLVSDSTIGKDKALPDQQNQEQSKEDTLVKGNDHAG